MNLANYITLFRILLIPFFFTELVSIHADEPHHRLVALVIFVLAALSDALDGLIARWTNTMTNLGRYLDPLADKSLLLSGYIGLLFVEALPFKPPLWITVTIVFRDMIIVGGMAVIFIMTSHVRIYPNLIGKMTTAFQMFTLIAILLQIQIAVPLCYVTAVLTILSCLVYCFRELRSIKQP